MLLHGKDNRALQTRLNATRNWLTYLLAGLTHVASLMRVEMESPLDEITAAELSFAYGDWLLGASDDDLLADIIDIICGCYVPREMLIC